MPYEFKPFDYNQAINPATRNALMEQEYMQRNRQEPMRNQLMELELKQRQADLAASQQPPDPRYTFGSYGTPEGSQSAWIGATPEQGVYPVGTATPRGQPLVQIGLGQTPDITDELGVPKARVAPWARISDPKKRDEAILRYGMAADKKLEKLTTDASSISKMANDLDRFMFLNETNETGGFVGSSIATSIRSPFDPEIAEMQAIVDKITPQMRQGMPGAASDRDVGMFRGATVGVNKPREANKNIASAVIVASQNKQNQIDFMSNYKLANGHLEGAALEWKKYLNANPIFDHKAIKGSYRLNPARQTYQEYFSKAEQGSGQKVGDVITAPNGQKVRIITIDSSGDHEVEIVR